MYHIRFKFLGKSLKKKISPFEISEYSDRILKNSFEFDGESYSQSVAKKFNYSTGYLKQVHVSEEQMKSFLLDFSLQYKALGEQFEHKIQQLS